MTLLALEVIYQLKKPYTVSDQSILLNKRLGTMTMADFEKSITHGRQYVLFNNYVIDVESFIGEHPGGSAMLLHHIGRDIGKYFYGAYSLERTMPRNQHSYFAFKILSKLAIAKLDHDTIFTPRKQEDYALKYSVNIFTVKETERIQRSIYRVKFSNPELLIKNFSGSSSFFGKSF